MTIPLISCSMSSELGRSYLYIRLGRPQLCPNVRTKKNQATTKPQVTAHTAIMKFLPLFALFPTALASVDICSRLINIVNLFSAEQCDHVQQNWVMATELDPQWFATMQTSNGCQNIMEGAKSIRVSYLDEKCSCKCLLMIVTKAQMS